MNTEHNMYMYACIGYIPIGVLILKTDKQKKFPKPRKLDFQLIDIFLSTY